MSCSGDVLATVAHLKIQANASKITVKSGKFTRVFTLQEWVNHVYTSFTRLVPLNEDVVSTSKQIYLWKGIGFRLKKFENYSHCDYLISYNSSILYQHNKQLGKQFGSTPLAHQNLPNQNNPRPFYTIAQNIAKPSIKDMILLLENFCVSHGQNSNDILSDFTHEALLTLSRNVKKNILGHKISRYVTQDVKVAVAVRDNGCCTHVENGVRCASKEELHYDHKFVPFKHGGPQSVWNLTLLCGTHNREKSDSMDWYDEIWKGIRGGFFA